MTAVKRRRTRATLLAFAAAVFALVAAAAIGVTGVQLLADSTAGKQAGGQADAGQTQRLPFTSTALVGVVDDDDRLTSLAAWVLEPDGVGGSIIGIAATADTASGTTGSLAPLASVYAVSGPEEFRSSVEQLTGLSFDVTEVVDQERFSQLIAPLGDLTVLFPVSFSDASSGDVWEAGEDSLTSPGAARAITASNPALADWIFESARASVWRSLPDRIGAGVGSVTPIASDQDVPTPRNLDEFADRLFAEPVAFRSLGFTPIDAGRVADQLVTGYVGALGPLDAVVAHDRAEMAIVFGAIAPSRLGAPLDAPVFRVVAPFTDADLDGLDLNRSDVLKRAIDGLFFAKANVISVADIDAEPVPEITQVEVADEQVIEAVQKLYQPLFGEIDVYVTAVPIDGIDIEVTLGRSFLDQLRGDSPPVVAGSGGDDDDDTTNDDG